ncbi:MAG: alpha/beta hydrolase [Proteobacteria bacterium]|nr:alpha/beta hydrolase [Pseudomonadota bacterium]
MRIVIVPRWGASPSDDWYPWLAEALPVPVEVVPLKPEADAPTIDAMVTALTEAAPAETLSETVFVGHSVGCQAIMSFLATQPATTRVPAFVAVAGWFELDSSWPPIRPWLEAELDTHRVRAMVQHIQVVLSDDDPYTKDHVANQAAWEDRLDAKKMRVPGAGHFNRHEEVSVLAAVRQAIDASVTAYALFEKRQNGVPKDFVEIERCGNNVVRRWGRALTWGEEHESFYEDTAEAFRGFRHACDSALDDGYDERLRLDHAPHRMGPAAFRSLVHKAARQTFAATRSARPSLHLNRYALFSDSSAMTIVHSVGSAEALAASEYPDDTRWLCAEYDQDDGGEFLLAPYRVLLAHYRYASAADHPDVFEAHARWVADACIGALEDLRGEGFFAPDDFVSFQVSSDDAGDDSIARLNTPSVVAEWKAWRATW